MEEVKGCEAPVDAAEAKVFGEVVFEFISALLGVSASASEVALGGCVGGVRTYSV